MKQPDLHSHNKFCQNSDAGQVQVQNETIELQEKLKKYKRVKV